MSDSELPWLGAVPSHWRLQRAKWLFRKMDRAVRETDEVITCFRDGVVTLRRNRRVRGFTESVDEFGYQGIRRGDLVIHAMDAFAGAVGVADADGKGTGVYSVCEARSHSDTRYYAYVIREMARSQWILALAKGIRERSTDFRFATFAAQFVPSPPIEEQRAIVRFLDHADRRVRRAISAKQELINLLNEEKQAIIRRAVTRGFDDASRLKPSGVDWLGEIPEHWNALALKRVLKRLIDCEHKTAPVVDSSEYRVVRTTGIRHGRLRMSGTYCTTAEAFGEWTRRGLPEPGDVIFTREAPAGEACIVPSGLNICLGQRTVLMKLNRERYDPHFLVHMIYAGPPAHRIKVASQGSTVGHFNMDDIAAMTIFAPPLDEQVAIVDRISDMTRGLDKAEECALTEIQLLREYRTRLVADVVTGKLDVRKRATRLSADVDEAEEFDHADADAADRVELVEVIEQVEA